MKNISFQLTENQLQAFNKIKDFLKSEVPVFILKGYAGTGKTTLIKQVVEYIHRELHREPLLMAPTGRAARVLQRKTGFNATTIHKGIYNLAEHKIEEYKDVAATKFKFVFTIRDAGEEPLTIVDESSMISSMKSLHELYQFGTDVLLDDFMTFSRPSFGGKVIFVGDPAQLPPVGDNKSNALNEEYFLQKGLKCSTFELTEILRQDNENIILSNAMAVRDLLYTDKRNELVFEEKQGEVERLAESSVLEKYMESGASASSGESVLIAFSNKQVSDYNTEVRHRLYGENSPLHIGEPIVVVKNNYNLGLMNGEFTTIISVGGFLKQSAPVWVQDGAEKRRDTIELTFQDVVVKDNNGYNKTCKLIVDLLDSEYPCLSVDQQKMLYINFKIRNPKLNHVNKEEYAELLKNDPYYNALQAKYGYAVTGHKCQGGEWKTAFVDYKGRTGLNDDCLRWNYTATTRAKDKLYVINLPNVTPFCQFRIDNIGTIRNMPVEFRAFSTIMEDPFHNDNAEPYLRAKTECVIRNLWGFSRKYELLSIESFPYRERYKIGTPNGSEQFDLLYRGSGIFNPAVPLQNTEYTAELKKILDDENNLPIKFCYTPSDEMHRQLYTRIQSCCDELGIMISNVVEHNEQYYTTFYFCTSGTASLLQVYNDGKGLIKYGKPQSIIGLQDGDLVRLLEKLQQ